jgi:hypothetical protein
MLNASYKTKFTFLHFLMFGGTGSVVSIATMLPPGWSGVRILVRATDLSLLQNFQTGSAYHPALCLLAIGVLSRD